MTQHKIQQATSQDEHLQQLREISSEAGQRIEIKYHMTQEHTKFLRWHNSDCWGYSKRKAIIVLPESLQRQALDNSMLIIWESP